MLSSEKLKRQAKELLEKIYETDYQTLVNYAYKVLYGGGRGDSGCAEDIVQEACAIAQAECDNRTEPPVSSKIPSKSRRFPRKLAWLVAVVALVATCSIATTAFQFDFFAKIASWTSETFQFVSEFIGLESNVVENDALAEFRDLVDGGYNISLVPTWCPEGYAVTDITQSALTAKRISAAILSDGNSEIIFTVTEYYNGITDSDIIGEKLDGDVTQLECGGATKAICPQLDGTSWGHFLFM